MARDEELKKRWEEVVKKLSAQFTDGDPLDLDGIIYLIGVHDAVTTAAMPPSKAAKRCSRISFVGLFIRV